MLHVEDFLIEMEPLAHRALDRDDARLAEAISIVNPASEDSLHQLTLMRIKRL
jgi:hypothetical protein